jgi:hypothetical protein
MIKTQKQFKKIIKKHIALIRVYTTASLRAALTVDLSTSAGGWASMILKVTERYFQRSLILISSMNKTIFS